MVPNLFEITTSVKNLYIIYLHIHINIIKVLKPCDLLLQDLEIHRKGKYISQQIPIYIVEVNNMLEN